MSDILKERWWRDSLRDYHEIAQLLKYFPSKLALFLVLFNEFVGSLHTASEAFRFVIHAPSESAEARVVSHVLVNDELSTTLVGTRNFPIHALVLCVFLCIFVATPSVAAVHVHRTRPFY